MMVGAAAGLPGACWPAAALAQGLAAPFPATPLLGLLAFLWLGALLALIVSRQRAARRAIAAERAAHLLFDLAAASPDGFLLVAADGQVRLSERAREWLGLGLAPGKLEDLAAAEGQGLDPASLVTLGDAVTALRRTGGARVMDLRAQGGSRLLKANLRAATPLASGAAPAIAIWLRDATEDQARLAAAQARVEKLETRLRRAGVLFEAAPYPIWLRDRDLKLTHVNKAYAEAVEASSPRAAVEHGIELLANPLSRSAKDAAQTALAEGKTQVRTEHVVIAGQRRALQVLDIPLADGQGVGGYAIDVTAEESARGELDRYTRAQAETLNMLSTPVATFGPEKQLIYYNTAFAELFRLKPGFLAERPQHGEILERMRDARRVPEQANFPAWKRAVLDQYTTLIEPAVETWHLPDETTLRVVTQPHPFGGLLMLFEDVTERLALERSFDTLIKVQRATLDNLQEGVAVFGSDGHVKLSNDVFGALWSLPRTVLDGAPHISDIVTLCEPLLHDAAAAQALHETVLAATEGRETVAGRLERADGKIVDYGAVPLPDGAALMTFIDVTDSVRIEKALRDRNEALETADRLKSEFVANMSYELRTPLTSIIGFGEMLEHKYFGPLNEKQDSYVRAILASSDRLLVLINDILDLAVTEAGAMALELSEIAVGELIDSALAMTQEQARAKGQPLAAEVAPDCPTFEGDERRLKQVLYNLIANAIRFSPEGGPIRINAALQDGMISLAVSDSGIGIKEEEREKVFERFRKGSNAGNVKSAGLGLALVRSFIELHGGTVNLESSVGKGTTVTCRIPLRPAPGAGDGA